MQTESTARKLGCCVQLLASKFDAKMSEDGNTKASSIDAVKIDPYKHLNIIPNPDGSITRLLEDPPISPMSDPSDPTPVLFKELTINPSKNTSARLFLPRHALSSSSKLPLIIYIPGGGFILSSFNSIPFLDVCIDFASKVNAVIVFANYRLAPQHRLPAAYDDAVEALMWVRNAPDEWLSQYVDFGKCYLMGGSAGANIVYNTSLRIASGAAGELRPLKIRGMIMHEPFFGGNKRTKSELKLADDKIFPQCVSDLMWELGLPKGADRDHEYCNPRASGVVEKMGKMGWRVLVAASEGDPLYDRQVEFARLMEEMGLGVVRLFKQGGYHGDVVFEPSRATLKNFIYAD